MPYVPATSHATLLATLRRQRLLPAPGTVVVEARQRVAANDVVARALVPEQHRMLDVARSLGLPADQADRALVKRDGDMVKAGEPIAERKALLGLWRRAARSPVDGRLVAAAGGKALVAAIPQPFELRARIPGTVVSILPDRGVVVEATGALLEGVWGNGRDDYAPLRSLGSQPDQALTAELIEPGLRGAIVAVGVLADLAALNQLAEIRVRGLLAGTLQAGLLARAQTLDFPVMVVEGFGASGFSAPAFGLVANNDGREAWLNAAAVDRFRGQRPELIVPLPGPGMPPPAPADGEALAVGKRVRVLRGPEAGRIGTVAELSPRLATLESGLRTRVAKVVFPAESGSGESSAPARVAYANLELLE